MQLPSTLFAEATPTADFTLNALLLLSLAGNTFVAWLTLSSRKEAQRRQVSFETEFATRSEVAELKSDFKALSTKLDLLGESLRQAGELRREVIEQRIDGLTRSVHELAVQVAHLEGTKP